MLKGDERRRRPARPWRALRLLAIALPFWAAAATAAPLRDAATGLSVDPPPGYNAAAVPPSGAQAARFALRRSDDQDTGCQLAYVSAPQNAGLTQAQINDLTRTPALQGVARARLSPVYDVREQSLFEHGGILRVTLVADLRPRDGLPARALALRSFFAILETPRGRTTMVCVADKTLFPARRAEFEAIARGIAPPR